MEPNDTRVVNHPWSASDETRLVAALRHGHLLAYPTETAFALGGNALLPKVTQGVYRLKRRGADKALLLLVDASRGVDAWAREASPAALTLMREFWPGPLTLVFHAAPHLPPHLADARATVALRWSPHPIIRDLLALGNALEAGREAAHPGGMAARPGGMALVGTSANNSGSPSLYTARDVLAAFPAPPGTQTNTIVEAGLALVIDARGGDTGKDAISNMPVSTVVDTTVDPPAVLREGAVSRPRLAKALGLDAI